MYVRVYVLMPGVKPLCLCVSASVSFYFVLLKHVHFQKVGQVPHREHHMRVMICGTSTTSWHQKIN